MRPYRVTLLCACAETANTPDSANASKDFFILVSSENDRRMSAMQSPRFSKARMLVHDRIKFKSKRLARHGKCDRATRAEAIERKKMEGVALNIERVGNTRQAPVQKSKLADIAWKATERAKRPRGCEKLCVPTDLPKLRFHLRSAIQTLG